MASTVDITIKAKDEASEVIKGVTGNFEELGQGAVEAKETGSEAVGEFLDNVNITMLGIYAAIELGKQAFQALEEAYESTVGKTLAIAGEIEELSRVSGDAPENMSALRIEAEKADVPFDDLYKAMENLNKNGVPPTLDNLVAIADEYAKLEDPIDRARFLTEEFGSAGDEIAPMLEAIAGGVKEVQNAGLIFTEADLQAAREHEQAIADLTAAWDNFTVIIGKKVIPVLTDLFNQVSDSSTISDLRKELGELALAARDAGKITPEQYEAVIKGAYDRTKTTGEAIQFLEYYIGRLTGASGEAAAATAGLTEAEQELADAAMAAALAQAEMIAELEAITSLDANYKGIISLAYEYTDILEDITEQEEVMATSEIGSEKWTEAKGKIEELKGTMTDLANQVTLDMFQATIAVGGVTEAELAAYMQMAIDMGLMSEEGAQAAIIAYNNAIETINGYSIDEKTGNVNIDAVAAFATLDLLQQYSLLDKEQRVFVKTYYGTSGSYDPYENYTGPAGTPANGQAIFAAAGASANLPYYWVGERGPEPFFPSVDGRIVSNTQAMAALRGGTNSEQIADAVKQGIKDAMRDSKTGNVYNLTMPTSSNPADVRTAFELMEAWNA